MLKNNLVIILLIFGLLSCTEFNNNQSIGNLLPDATGGADELMVFISDVHLNDSLAKNIKQILVEPYKIMPQAEARFTVSTAGYSKMNTILKRFINPIFILTQNEKSALKTELYSILSEADQKKIEQSEQLILFKKNFWAANQSVVIIVAPNVQNIEETIQKYKKDIHKHYDNSNVIHYKKIAFIDGVNMSLKKQFKDYHGLNLEIPRGYVLAKNEGNMVLLRKDLDKSTLFLCFDLVDYNADIPLNNLGIEKFNKIGKYIDGENAESYVTADTTLGFKLEIIREDSLIKFENAGLWVMENDFVGGGPFINQYIIDNKKKRIIYLSGMVYGPGEKKKKKYMRQFEAIFSTLKVIE